MTEDKTYNVIFAGEILEGRDPGEVKKGLGQVLDLDPDEVEFLFGDEPMVIRTGVAREEAMGLRHSLYRVGAMCMVKSEEPAEEKPNHPAGATTRMVVCPHCNTSQQTARECKFCGQRMKRPKT